MEDEGQGLYGLHGSCESPHRQKLIISAALTGNVPMKSDNPNVPLTPEEIVADARRCFGAGAAYFHIHAREEDGRPSCRRELFEEIMAGLRKHCPSAVVCLTTSGRIFTKFEERSSVLELDGVLKPEFASLSLGSMNFPKEASMNHPDMIGRLADAMVSRGIRPELEVFETGMINYAAYLTRKGRLRAPFFFNLFFGLLGTMPGRVVDVCHQVQSLPPGSCWAAAGGGRFQLPVTAAAMSMGGHVRVGLEDNVYYDYEKTVPATNKSLVERAVRLAREMGRPVASASEARRMLGLE